MKYVVPRSLRELILSLIHEGHLGIVKCHAVKKLWGGLESVMILSENYRLFWLYPE